MLPILTVLHMIDHSKTPYFAFRPARKDCEARDVFGVRR